MGSSDGAQDLEIVSMVSEIPPQYIKRKCAVGNIQNNTVSFGYKEKNVVIKITSDSKIPDRNRKKVGLGHQDCR